MQNWPQCYAPQELPPSTSPTAMASDGKPPHSALPPEKSHPPVPPAARTVTPHAGTTQGGAAHSALPQSERRVLSLPSTTKHPQPRGSQSKPHAKQKARRSATEGLVIATRSPSWQSGASLLCQSLFQKGRGAVTAVATGVGGVFRAPWRQTFSSAAAVASTWLGHARALVAVGVAGGPPVIA